MLISNYMCLKPENKTDDDPISPAHVN